MPDTKFTDVRHSATAIATSSYKAISVSKAWGMEVWYANEPEYCGKLLLVRDGGKSSLHYHKIKKETFYVHNGIIRLEHGEKDELLFPGESRTILPGTPHRFSSVRGGDILEFSTHHDDADTIRLEPSQEM